MAGTGRTVPGVGGGGTDELMFAAKGKHSAEKGVRVHRLVTSRFLQPRTTTPTPVLRATQRAGKRLNAMRRKGQVRGGCEENKGQGGRTEPELAIYEGAWQNWVL